MFRYLLVVNITQGAVFLISARNILSSAFIYLSFISSSMVRVNLVQPEMLADQHLIAEYNEILMLTAYIRTHPETADLPKHYCLGKGHMRF
jgi:hypothetical protein